MITFSGTATCTAAKPTAELACPIQILVDGQATGKVNFAPATAATPTPVPIVNTVMQTTVLAKGGHTVAVQYAGAEKVTFTLKAGTSRSRPTRSPRKRRPTETTRDEIGEQAAEPTAPDSPGAVGSRARPQGQVAVSARGAGSGRGGAGLAEDQAGPVVEGLVGRLPGRRLAAGAPGWSRFCRCPAGVSSRTRPVSRPREMNFVWSLALLIAVSFLGLLTI